MAARISPLSKVIEALRNDDLTGMQKLLRADLESIKGTAVVERLLQSGVTEPQWRGDVVGSESFKRPANASTRMLHLVFQEYAQARVTKSITPPLVEMFDLLPRWVSAAQADSAEQAARLAVTGTLIEQHWHLLDRTHREAVVGRMLTQSGAGGFNLMLRWLTEDQRLEKLSDKGPFLRPVSLLRTPTIFIDVGGGKGKSESDDGLDGWKRLVSQLLATAPLPKLLRIDLTPKAFEDAMGRGQFGNSEQMATFVLSALRPHLKPEFKKLADNLMVGPALEDIIQRADTQALNAFLTDNPELSPIEGWVEFEEKAIGRTAAIFNAVLEHERDGMRKTRGEHLQNLAEFAQLVLDTCEQRVIRDAHETKASAKFLVETQQRLREGAMRSTWYRQLERATLDEDIRSEGLDRLEHLVANPWNDVLRAVAKRRNPEWHDASTPEGLLARLKDEAAPSKPRKKP